MYFNLSGKTICLIRLHSYGRRGGSIKQVSLYYKCKPILFYNAFAVQSLFEFAHHPELVSAIQSLLGDEFYSLASNIFNKPPGVDGKHPMHQDLRYFKLSPADKIVGVWTAMFPATRETGCLAVIPNSHKQGPLEHDMPDWDFVNYGFYGVKDLDISQRVHVELQPGDTLLFHPLLIHGSGSNKSDGFRRAISMHCASVECTSEKGDWRSNEFCRRIA